MSSTVALFAFVLATGPWLGYLEIASEEYYHGKQEVQQAWDFHVRLTAISVAFALGAVIAAFYFHRAARRIAVVSRSNSSH